MSILTQTESNSSYMHTDIMCFYVLVFRYFFSLKMPYSSVLKWPPRSPDLTPCDFFLWGYVKGLVYVPPLPTNVVELKQRISSALETVTEDMLQ